MEKRTINLLRFFLKLTLSLVAVYVVVQNIDRQELTAILRSANPGWLVAGIVGYNLSKILSSFRLSYYLRASGLHLSEKENLRLYYIGMFYNLFLPGGIGGDGYKVWLLSRDTGVTTKSVFQAVLFDRISGMVLLCTLAFLFGWLAFPELPYRHMLLVAAVASIPALFFMKRLMAKQFLPSFAKTTLLSAGVQGIQVLCAWTLLNCLGIGNHPLAYITVFLVSSVVSVLPISIGGIGIRELVFLAAAGLSPIARDASVAFSFLFFLVTAISSLPGSLLPTPAVTKT